MPKVTQAPARTPSPAWVELESFARVHVPAFIQRPLEEEIEEQLGRRKSVRASAPPFSHRGTGGTEAQAGL